MPQAIVLSRTQKAQEFWIDPINRVRLESVLRHQASQPDSFGVLGGDFLVDHMFTRFPEGVQTKEPDVLVLIIYSVKPHGLVPMETGDHVFTKAEADRMLIALKEKFPDFIWGPWNLPQHGAGYSEG